MDVFDDGRGLVTSEPHSLDECHYVSSILWRYPILAFVHVFGGGSSILNSIPLNNVIMCRQFYGDIQLSIFLMFSRGGW